MYTYSASVSYHVLFILRVVNVVYVARSHLLIFIACERHLLCQQHKTAMRSVPDPFSAGVGLACETTRAQGQQVVNLANLEDSFAVVHGSMTSLAENCEKWLSCWARVRPVST